MLGSLDALVILFRLKFFQHVFKHQHFFTWPDTAVSFGGSIEVDFRNYARLDADFAPGFHLLLGDNAQGKTNILEAIYLMATLRSFRGVG